MITQLLAWGIGALVGIGLAFLGTGVASAVGLAAAGLMLVILRLATRVARGWR